MKVHQTYVVGLLEEDPSPLKYQARCTCSWKGTTELNEGEARAQAVKHGPLMVTPPPQTSIRPWDDA